MPPSDHAAERMATYEDLLRVPRNRVAEVLSGRLVTHPRPAPRPALASSALGVELGDGFSRRGHRPGGWWILDEPELHLGPDIVVPDLAGWRRTRMPELPEAAFFTQPPDWVCEVLSPSTAREDRVQKLPIYAREEVGHVWLVDPDLMTLEAYELRDGAWVLLRGFQEDDAVSIAPFEAITFSLSMLWP